MVERDRGAKLMTTYTPEFLGLPDGIWRQEGGDANAGEGLVIGFVDTGINPLHPSFAYDPTKPYISNTSTTNFKGFCETGPGFPETSCNSKIVSARFFSAGAQAAATLNSSYDFLSPLDAVGHGRYINHIYRYTAREREAEINCVFFFFFFFSLLFFLGKFMTFG